MLILAAFAIAKGLQVVRPDIVKTRLASPILTGALLLLLAGLRYGSLRSDVDSLRAIPGITASIGSGFWIGVIGALMVTLGGALIQFRDSPGCT
jgi:putative copper export protein